MQVNSSNSKVGFYPAGTQVVVTREVVGPNGRTAHPRGSVAVVVHAPSDQNHAYRVRFIDGVEESLLADELIELARYKAGELAEHPVLDRQNTLYDRVIYRCVIGSRAYGLEDESSDTDRRGVYLPRASEHWSLYGVPEQLECDETQEAYWELQKFLVLALKANPNVLECLYSPIVEKATPLGQHLLAHREIFLSRLVYQTYNGYVMSQFKKMQTDIRNQGRVKWKHVMHLIRLLISGIHVLRHGFVPVRVDEHRDRLLAIKHGQLPWPVTQQWREALHSEFELAFKATQLPDRPDYGKANHLLIEARRAALGDDLP